MSDEPAPAQRYRVVCRYFVSAGFDTAHDAQLHLELTKSHGGCKDIHRVEFTDLPYGSTGVKQ